MDNLQKISHNVFIMKSHEIRLKFQQYFQNQGHAYLPSASLIPKEDPSLLFTNAGMNPFKDCFLGLATPPHPKVCSIQKCLRAGGKHNDLEQVGPSSHHHTFFEMMGHFSFGAYFKREAIHHAFEFLTKELSLPKDRLYVSVFREDRESMEIWKKDQHFPSEKIFALEEKDNFWRMGDTGPCGPCTEIHYYEGPKKNPRPEDMTEVWNLVFMQFNELFKEGKKVKVPLPRPAVDTGMGLERLSAIMQGQTSNYQTDLFKGLMTALEKVTGISYEGADDNKKKTQMAFRVLADHSRAVAFLIADGVLPASEGAGYVLRRILRRAFFYGQKLSSRPDLLCVPAQSVVDFMEDIYPELLSSKSLIDSTIKAEARLWTKSLKEGKGILLKKISSLSTGEVKTLSDFLVWDLYSTYGFPPDLTRLIAKEQGFEVNPLTLEELKNRFLSPKATKAFQQGDKESLITKVVEMAQSQSRGLSKTLWTGYEREEEEAQVVAVSKALDEGGTGFVVLDKSCFYPEGGGPVGDRGLLEWEKKSPLSAEKTGKGPEEGLGPDSLSVVPTGRAFVKDTQKKGDWIVHEVKVLKGGLRVGQQVRMKVDGKHRQWIAVAHSATHLLNKALQDLLGKETRQMGSLVEPGQLRFDFSHPQPLSPEQIRAIDQRVNGFIEEGHKVRDFTCSYKEALSQGAVFLAGENYPEQVRLIKMGKSLELCGGIHVKNTSEIKGFTITAETGVKSGVRRIVAYVGEVRQKWLELLARQNQELRSHLNLTLPKLKKNPLSEERTDTKADFMAEQILAEQKNPFIAFIRKKEEEIQELNRQMKKLYSLNQDWTSLLKKAKPFECKGEKGLLIVTALPIEDKKQLADMADNIKSKAGVSAVVVMGEGKGQYPLVITLSKELQKHISAGDLFKNTISPLLDGRGGGQARFAQGVIKNKSRFPDLEKPLLKILNNSS